MSGIEPARRRRILVVDDDPRVLALFRRLTRRMNGTFDFASSAEEAHALCERAVPDAIICDYRLPGIDGLSFLEKVHDRWPYVRRFLHTGEAVLRTSFGVDVPVLAKPVPADELEALLQTLLVSEGP